jgi:putative salt-induced outer membrane protein YdiY
MRIFRVAGIVALVCACLVAAPRAARAQIVNVQSQIGDVPQGFSGAFDAAADWRTGNTSFLLLSGATTLRWRSGNHLVFAVAKGEYGRLGTDSTVFVEHSFEHLRYRFHLNDRVTLEAFAQHEYDQFRRLRLRALVGAGPRLTLYHDERADLILGVAYMLAHEELDKQMGALDAGETTTDHRLSSYVVFTYKVNDKVVFSETAYAQPKLTGFSDVRILDETQLAVKLTERFAFKSGFVLAYDSEPPDTKKKLDTVLQTGVSIKF